MYPETVVFQVLGVLLNTIAWGAIIAVIYLIARAGRSPANGHPWRRPISTPDFFAIITHTDPAFTWEGFCARAVSAYEVVQRARMVRQPNLAARWVTPRLLTGLENESAFSASHDVDRAVAPLTIEPILARKVYSDGTDFYIDLSMTAITTRRVRDALFGIAESRTPEGLMDNQVLVAEVWTFSRPIGALTGVAAPEGLTRCPYCGAPVKDPRVADCEYCGKSLYDGAGEWLVSAITPNELAPTLSPQRPASQMGVS